MNENSFMQVRVHCPFNPVNDSNNEAFCKGTPARVHLNFCCYLPVIGVQSAVAESFCVIYLNLSQVYVAILVSVLSVLLKTMDLLYVILVHAHDCTYILKW